MRSMKRKRKFWVHHLLQSRDEEGEFNDLNEESKLYHGCFWTYFRMSMGQSINFILGFICQTTLKIMNLSPIVVDVIVGEDFTSSLHNNCDGLVCLFVCCTKVQKNQP